MGHQRGGVTEDEEGVIGGSDEEAESGLWNFPPFKTAYNSTNDY